MVNASQKKLKIDPAPNLRVECETQRDMYTLRFDGHWLRVHGSVARQIADFIHATAPPHERPE